MDQDTIKELKEQIGFAFDYVEFKALADASLENKDYDLCNATKNLPLLNCFSTKKMKRRQR